MNSLIISYDVSQSFSQSVFHSIVLVRVLLRIQFCGVCSICNLFSGEYCLLYKLISVASGLERIEVVDPLTQPISSDCIKALTKI